MPTRCRSIIYITPTVVLTGSSVHTMRCPDEFLAGGSAETDAKRKHLDFQIRSEQPITASHHASRGIRQQSNWLDGGTDSLNDRGVSDDYAR